MDNRSLSHTKWKCQYHIVFIPKYRKKVIYGKIRDDVREKISTLCKYKNVEIIAGAVCIVRLSVAIPPKISISNFMGYLKGKSTLMLYDRHPDLQSKWDKAFWASSNIALLRANNKPPVELVVHDLDSNCEKERKGDYMEQQKHESDLTKQEKRQEEKRRLKQLKGRERAAHIWAYYKLQIFIGIAVVIAVACVGKWAYSFRYQQILYVGVVNQAGADGTAMADAYRDFIGDTDKFHMVDVDTTLALETGSDTGDLYGNVRFATFTSGYLYDVVLMNEVVYEKYKDLDIFADLQTYLGDAYSDYSGYTSDHKAIVYEQNAVLQKFGISGSEPVYAMISADSKNKEYVMEYLDFLQTE